MKLRADGKVRRPASISQSYLIGCRSGNRLSGVRVGGGRCSWNIFTCLTVVMKVTRVWRQAVEVTISYHTALPPTSCLNRRFVTWHTLCACVLFNYRAITNIFWGCKLQEFCRWLYSVCGLMTPITEVTRSKARVYGSSAAGIAGSNSVGVIDVFVVGVVCFQVIFFSTGWSLVQKNRTECSVFECHLSNLNSEGV